MPWWTWLSLGVCVGVALAALAAAAVAAIRMFRGARRLARGLETAAGRLERLTAELAARGERAGVAQDELAASAGALSASVARLRLLLAALEDARRLVGIVRGLAPSK